ncbi:hypothetical protein AUJ84_03990 [Candidatus Pacearchaeota archaeon CG1_02_32_132]|nr:MAG: hypothetical protein AUJ84_03990 [Candidatus Pacearchaeota archaeon CG1_02_32_132]
MVDYTLIGGGIIGLSIARELSSRKLGDVLVIEKETHFGQHASGRNSGVIHSGINQKPGTLKAKLCIEGSHLLRTYCKENDVPIEECGTLTVANSNEEARALHTLELAGVHAGVKGLRIISQDELLEREPMAKGLCALLSPTGAIVNTGALMRKMESDIWAKGVEFWKNSKVIGIEESDDRILLETKSSIIETDYLINCAGVHADTIAHMMGVGKEFRVLPFRGDYFKFPGKVNSMVYQVPDLRFPFLGVHLTKTMQGEVLVGPTATLSLAGKENYDGGFSWEGLSEISSRNFYLWATKARLSRAMWSQVKHNRKLSKDPDFFIEEVGKIYSGEIPRESIEPYNSGIRAQLVDRSGTMVNDFLIRHTNNSTHVLNAVSPGMTSSMAVAREVVDEIERRRNY